MLSELFKLTEQLTGRLVTVVYIRCHGFEANALQLFRNIGHYEVRRYSLSIHMLDGNFNI